jgi:hypothetical protein
MLAEVIAVAAPLAWHGGLSAVGVISPGGRQGWKMVVSQSSSWKLSRALGFAAISALVLIGGCKPASPSNATSTAAGAAPAGAPQAGGPEGGAVIPVSNSGQGGAPSTFEDPTEHAFSVSVPAGWTAKGGIIRKSALQAQPWIQETSADGLATVFYGDPSIPNFLTPSPLHADGTSVSSQYGGVEPVTAYEPAGQFAAGYAQQVYGQGCANMQASGGQPEPAIGQQTEEFSNEMAQAVGSTVPPASYDSASALFTCQVNGQPYVVGVYAVTAYSQAAAFWSVPLVFGYRAPAAEAQAADDAARALQAGYTRDPQWQAKMIAVGKQAMDLVKQQGAEAMAEMNQLQRQEGAALNAQATANMNRLTSEHNAFMASFNAQGAARNAAFAQQEYMKGSQTQAYIRVIKDQTCVVWNDAAHTSCRVVAQN